MADPAPPEDRDGYYSVYAEHARTLRTWLVAYGVGGPVLFLTQDTISQKITASGGARGIVCLFLGGVAAQILVSLINKWSQWGLYAATVGTRAHSFARRVASWCLNDIIGDALSIVLFGWATLWVVLVVAER